MKFTFSSLAAIALTIASVTSAAPTAASAKSNDASSPALLAVSSYSGASRNLTTRASTSGCVNISFYWIILVPKKGLEMEKRREQQHSFRLRTAGDKYNDYMRPQKSQGASPLYMESRDSNDHKWQATHNDYFLEDKKRAIYLSTSGLVRMYGKPNAERLDTNKGDYIEWTMEWWDCINFWWN